MSDDSLQQSFIRSTGRSRRRKRRERPRRDHDRRRHLQIAAALLTALLAIGAGVLAGIAGSTPVPAPVPFTKGVATLPPAPFLGGDWTLYADATGGSPAPPDSFGCTVTADGLQSAPTAPPPLSEVGSRVLGEASLVPVANLGHPTAEAQVRCTGRYAVSGRALWAVSTGMSPRERAMYLTVASVLLLALAALILPRRVRRL